MHCFYHTETVALGVCKACMKGICKRCAVDKGNGLACIDSCEYHVETLNLIIQFSEKSILKQKHPVLEMIIFFILMGLLFLIDAIVQLPIGYFAGSIAIIFLVIAALFYNRYHHPNKRLRN